MIEWVLVVWMVVAGPAGPVLAPAYEVGSFWQQDRCEKSLATVKFERDDVSFVAVCIERDK